MTFTNTDTDAPSVIENLDTPIFLIGAERSGTTLLRLMLNGHPKVAWCHEFEYAVDQVSDAGGWPDLAQYHEWLGTHRIFLANHFTVDKALSYPDLLNSFLSQKCDRHGKPIVGATVHRHFHRLLKLWPNAKLIYLLRDGRDVARSNIGMGWAGNVWTGAQRWIEVEAEWQRLKPTLAEKQWIELRYENLIKQPEQQLSRLCEFIGVPYSPDMMGYVDNTTYRYPDPKRIQQWRKKLSPRQIRLVESRISDILAQRNYTLSGLPSLTVTLPLQKALRLQDWAYRARYRMGQYGLPLFAADYLSRKLGIKRWQKRVQMAINEEQTKRLA